jgi:hypothetical protein
MEDVTLRLGGVCRVNRPPDSHPDLKVPREEEWGRRGKPKAVIDALIGHEGDSGKIYTTVGEQALRDAASVIAKVLPAD